MEKIWLKSYQTGTQPEIDLSYYTSGYSIFETAVSEFPTRPAYHSMGKTLTYQEADQHVKHFARYLRHNLNLAKGERIAIMMPNLLQYPVVVFGSWRAELAIVNINPLYTPRELEHQLIDSGATTIVVLENFANTLEKVLPQTAIKNIIIAKVGDLLGAKGPAVSFAVRHIKKMVPKYTLPNTIPFNTVLKKGKNAPPFTPNLNHQDTAFLQYTSGTTGVAKGVILTHGNIVANALQVKSWITPQMNIGEEVVVVALPLYHIFSLTANLMTFTMLGSLSILISNPRDMTAFIKELNNHKVTILTGVNTLFNSLLNHPDFQTLDFSSWRYGFGGGMAVQRSVAERWQQVTKTPLVEAYGLTETSPAACMNPLTDKNRIGTIGLPIPSTLVSIRDLDGHEVPIGQPGELWIKGPQVMAGYWKRPKDTEEVFDSESYFSSGDMATISDDGYVTLIDRKKDMVLVSGFNVYPNEVENVLAGHPLILESACIGVPDEKTGEAVKVFIVAKDDNLSAEEVTLYSRQFLTGYKVPKNIEFRRDLPKNPVGKILRQTLRDEAQEQVATG